MFGAASSSRMWVRILTLVVIAEAINDGRTSPPCNKTIDVEVQSETTLSLIISDISNVSFPVNLSWWGPHLDLTVWHDGSVKNNMFSINNRSYSTSNSHRAASCHIYNATNSDSGSYGITYSETWQNGTVYEHTRCFNVLVISMPSTVTISRWSPIDSANSKVGIFNVGDDAQLQCTAFGGRPQPRLKWRMGNYEIRGTPTSNLKDGHNTALMTWPNLNRGDHGRVISCIAEVGSQGFTKEDNAVLNLRLSPKGIRISGQLKGTANSVLKLTCEVEGGFPPAIMSWYINEEKILPNTFNSSISWGSDYSELSLRLNRDMHRSNVSCVAYTPGMEKNTLRTAEQVLVSGPPSVTLRPLSQVVPLNGTLRLTCTHDSDPAANLMYWVYNGTNEFNRISEVSGATVPLEHTIRIDNVTFRETGTFQCVVGNYLGNATSTVAYVYLSDAFTDKYGWVRISIMCIFIGLFVTTVLQLGTRTMYNHLRAILTSLFTR